MTMKVSDIIGIMEKIAPVALAEKWDNSGLQAGNADWSVHKIRVALDPLPGVVARAVEDNVDLLITHHPLIFTPLKSVDFSTGTGSVIWQCARHEMSVFSAHTNLDIAWGGLNDLLAGMLGIKSSVPLLEGWECADCPSKSQGLGRVGELAEETSLKALAGMVKERLNSRFVRITGDPEMLVSRVALCTGSGSGLMKEFLGSGAQVYISGDLKYHDARDAEAAGVGLIDAGHFPSEHIVVENLRSRLERALVDCGHDILVDASELEEDPFRIL